jgi:hypothetical protein
MGSRGAAVCVTFSLFALTGCVMGREDNVGGDGSSPREQRAARLVEAQAGEPVECKDNGGVNVEVLPDYPVGYSCYNEAGEFYNIVVSPDGVVLSFSGPARLKPAKS